MQALSSEDNERAAHLNSIEILAKELQRTPEEVSGIYMSILRDIEKDARVKIFLHIFVSRRVRDIVDH